MKRLGILGVKVGMTQVFDKAGNRVPVTVVKAEPNVILEVKTVETHGYNALQVGVVDQKPQRLNKPDLGRFTKHDITPKRFVKEFRLDASASMDYKVGDFVKISDVLAIGDPVDITGTSKGKGFQGVMKRWNFSGAQTETHGTHEYFRHGGSIGNRLTPGRVIKGRKMGGQMGNKKVTVQNVKIVDIDTEANLIMLQGGVPGAVNGLVKLAFATKKRVYL